MRKRREGGKRRGRERNFHILLFHSTDPDRYSDLKKELHRHKYDVFLSFNEVNGRGDWVSEM